MLLVLIYPPFSAAPLAWVALTPLLIALEGTSPVAAFLMGWLAGTIGVLGVTGVWIFSAAHDYFQLSLLSAAAFTLAVTQVFVSLYFGLFGLAVSRVDYGRWRFVVIAMLFVASEYARAHLLSGCPWGLLGHSQAALELMQIGDLTGVYGLSFLLVLAAAALVQIRQTRLPIVVALLLTIATFAYGYWRLDALTRQQRPVVRVALVQANLPNLERGQPEHYHAHLERYLALSTGLLQHDPHLLVWPENAIGFFPEANPALVQRITDMLQVAASATLLAGAPRAAGGDGVAALYNSAYLFSPAGIGTVYDKRTLLPFVERMPLRPADGPYLPGSEATIFSIPDARFGVLICYEIIYPELARELVEGGAQLLINISNDSWFEAGAGPEQHYEIARFRAVENRVGLVRVTNSGVSAVVDPLGRELASLPQGVATATVAVVPLGGGGSWYTRHGDVFAVTCIVGGLGALALVSQRRVARSALH